jgi:type I restriction enzyme M protein
MFVQSGAREVFGQESNPATWRLAKLNCALHGIGADLGAGPADTFADDRHAGRAADVVLANPPFNQSAWGARDEARWRFGAPPAGNANFAWLQQVLAHLEPDGRAGVVLANGSLTSTRGGEGAIRRRLVEAGWVDAIVALPSHLFFSTTIPACVWILSRERPGTTLLVDARGLGRMVSRTHRELDDADVDRIADAYRAYADEAGFARVVDEEALEARRFVLAPGRYVERRAGTSDAGAARKRLRTLAREWRALSGEAEQVAAEIRELDLGLE